MCCICTKCIQCTETRYLLPFLLLTSPQLIHYRDQRVKTKIKHINRETQKKTFKPLWVHYRAVSHWHWLSTFRGFCPQLPLVAGREEPCSLFDCNPIAQSTWEGVGSIAGQSALPSAFFPFLGWLRLLEKLVTIQVGWKCICQVTLPLGSFSEFLILEILHNIP